MLYAEVSVNSPAAQRRLFSYAIPDGMRVDTGQAVWVPFGDKVLQGVVLEIRRLPSVEETKSIAGVIEEHPLLSQARVALAKWLSEYYLCPLFDAVTPMLPPGFERQTLTFVSATTTDKGELSTLPPAQRQVLELARKEGRVALKHLEKMLGKKVAQSAVSRLVARGLAFRRYELEPVRIKPKEEPFLSLAIAADEAQKMACRLAKKAPRQAALLDFLLQQPQPVPSAEARRITGCPPETIRTMAGKGLIQIQPVVVKRQPLSYKDIPTSLPPELSADQKQALGYIRESLDKNEPSVFLLHGVTGSGKTEVYLQALAETTKRGKRGIVLVPEIALTPQTIERFAARFPNKVAVLHSQLSLGERFDQWQEIRDGRYDVVIGARSAIFAPQPDLGLIAIDEEHEWSYKQDVSPCYHARNVALKLAEVTGAVAILGSATPDVESFYRARRGDYHLLQLPQRLTPHEGSELPQVSVVDMKEELKTGNRSIFSRRLNREIEQAVGNGEQVILFYNRRGSATLVQCRECGFILNCRRCQVSLSYHSAENALICHRCNYRTTVPRSCPRCLGGSLKFLGIGTQKLEAETALAFPGARLLRWDSDAIRGEHSHRQILERFRSHEADILIGTQIIAKGLDLPLVTLVGVVSADTSLNLPDFRAGERTFQLLCQVAGRAGRGTMGGRVIIQSYCPEHYAIQAAITHDYASFYQHEIAYRRQLNHPPFSQLARLTYSHTNNAVCRQAAIRMKRQLSSEIESQGIAGISLIGPTPAFTQRLRGRYRWQIILRGSELSRFLAPLSIPKGWAVDIDPAGLS